ncbi:hypothetical protein [Ancylobacter polymorphus]|uniref:Uncharacterized protein n=1 Tax=Ancylobacter polymorphus TaxID=223390 RepID=A0ABU0B7J9_9HYPH|nr:hypothetical protein [Ancylobacter polymorphus]MDQ0301360.1 hypothetical protein [Ancylobacter polymorphus]
MTLEKPFRVLPSAGSHVAGQRIRDAEILAGRAPLMLTDAQAEHPLRQQVIEPFGEEPAKKGKK